MFGAVLLMLPVSWIYKGIHREGEHDQSLDETTLILPAVVAGIVMVVQHSLALAFSLAGIVAGVQFRRALSDTFDTLFIFVAIAVGIAAGIKALDIALVLTVFFNFATLFVCIWGDGLESHYEARRKRERRARKEAEQRAAAAMVSPESPRPDSDQ
jgi:phosphotransferase system  glucose/maltose/N-acetylglucosamine-specific IIC component